MQSLTFIKDFKILANPTQFETSETQEKNM